METTATVRANPPSPRSIARWKPNVRLAFKNVFTYKQWKRLSRDLDIPFNATPTDVTFEQWLGLYQSYRQKLSCGHLCRRDEVDKNESGTPSERLR